MRCEAELWYCKTVEEVGNNKKHNCQKNEEKGDVE